MREKGIWLRKWKKIKVVFLVIVLGLKGEVTGSFHQTFGEFLWYIFSLIFFLFMFPRVMDSRLKSEFNYCIPIYWSGRNFLYGFFTSIQRGFPRYIWCPLLWLNVLDCHSWFLLGYYSWEVVIIVEESFNLGRLIL